MNGKIYIITCLINDKKYVGQTITSIEKRWKKHLNGSNWDKRIKNVPLQLAFKKYGIENFKIELLEENIINQNDLNEREIFYSNMFKTLSPNGYNLRVGGANGSLSEEVKNKISKANKGRKRTEIWLNRLSESHMGNKHTPETKKKLSEIFKGKPIHINTKKSLQESLIKEYTFLSPDGDIVEIKNLKKFCEENNLLDSKMNLVNKGIRNHHKGWTKNENK